MAKKRIAIVNVNLQYEIPDYVKDVDVNDYLFGVELPEEYVEDSFELVKIIKE
jgi:hypothetical protein